MLCLLATLACRAVSQADETLTIQHMPPDTSFDQRDAYALALLQLALDRNVDDHGPAATATGTVSGQPGTCGKADP